MTFEIPIEKRIGVLDTVADLLNRLRVEFIPERKPLCLFELGDVLLKSALAEVFAEQMVVAAMKSDEVIVDTSREVDRPVKVFVPLRVIHLEYERPHYLHRPFADTTCFSDPRYIVGSFLPRYGQPTRNSTSESTMTAYAQAEKTLPAIYAMNTPSTAERQTAAQESAGFLQRDERDPALPPSAQCLRRSLLLSAQAVLSAVIQLDRQELYVGTSDTK